MFWGGREVSDPLEASVVNWEGGAESEGGNTRASSEQPATEAKSINTDIWTLTLNPLGNSSDSDVQRESELLWSRSSLNQGLC